MPEIKSSKMLSLAELKKLGAKIAAEKVSKESRSKKTTTQATASVANGTNTETDSLLLSSETPSGTNITGGARNARYIKPMHLPMGLVGENPSTQQAIEGAHNVVKPPLDDAKSKALQAVLSKKKNENEANSAQKKILMQQAFNDLNAKFSEYQISFDKNYQFFQILNSIKKPYEYQSKGTLGKNQEILKNINDSFHRPLLKECLNTLKLNFQGLPIVDDIKAVQSFFDIVDKFYAESQQYNSEMGIPDLSGSHFDYDKRVNIHSNVSNPIWDDMIKVVDEALIRFVHKPDIFDFIKNRYHVSNLPKIEKPTLQQSLALIKLGEFTDQEFTSFIQDNPKVLMDKSFILETMSSGYYDNSRPVDKSLFEDLEFAKKVISYDKQYFRNIDAEHPNLLELTKYAFTECDYRLSSMAGDMQEGVFKKLFSNKDIIELAVTLYDEDVLRTAPAVALNNDWDFMSRMIKLNPYAATTISEATRNTEQEKIFDKINKADPCALTLYVQAFSKELKNMSETKIQEVVFMNGCIVNELSDPQKVSNQTILQALAAPFKGEIDFEDEKHFTRNYTAKDLLDKGRFLQDGHDDPRFEMFALAAELIDEHHFTYSEVVAALQETGYTVE